MIPEFVDTNVLLYAHDKGEREKHQRATQLLGDLNEAGSGAISTQVLIEFYSVSTRAMKFSSQDAGDIVEGFRLWRMHSPTHSSVLQAIQLQRRYKLSWFDALIVTSALALECSILWTEDMQHNQHFGSLTIKNPFR